MVDWIFFSLLIAALLLVDLGVFHRRQQAMKMKDALLWSGFWIFLSLGFNLYLFFLRGSEAALQFFTGYLVEKSLSADNLFVLAALFSYFEIPVRFQHKVLYYGILGALFFRLVLIMAGIALIDRFSWLLYFLGAFLALTGIKMIAERQQEQISKESWIVRLFRRFFPVDAGNKGGDFFVRRRGVLMATPLFIALLAVETTDILFALDSIPAVFAITRDPFIIYTSNMFAILGLRSLYFVLAASLEKFHYLKKGLGVILAGIGAKMLIAPWYEVPLIAMLLFILADLLLAILLSLRYPKPDKG